MCTFFFSEVLDTAKIETVIDTVGPYRPLSSGSATVFQSIRHKLTVCDSGTRPRAIHPSIMLTSTVFGRCKVIVGGAGSGRPNRSSAPTQVKALFGFGGRDEEKERQKEEQMRAQQEVLKRRKTNSWQAGVKDRRAKASRYLNDPEFKKACDEENRKKFKERQAMEEPEPTSGFRIIVPITPFGMPEYDGGERFDLRLPYVDNGWVDEDADPVKQFRRFIGLDKKQSNGSEVQGGKTKGKKK